MSQITDTTGLETAGILRRFLREAHYHPSNASSTNEELEGKMLEYMESREIARPQLERTLHLAASFVEMAFRECTLAEKVNIAIFNWFIIYIDDAHPENVGPFIAFRQRFLSRTQQLDPILDAFVDILLRIHDHYEETAANYILSSALNYVNSACLDSEVEEHTSVPDMDHFPWFIRDHTSLSVAFALMLFPKSKGASIVERPQVLDEMNFWISGVKDVMLFYKEELTGGTNNYIYNRSHAEKRPVIDILTEVSHKLLVSREAIRIALVNTPGAGATWSAFENGYIKYLIQERFQLVDLNF